MTQRIRYLDNFFENLEWTFTPNETCYFNAWKMLIKGTKTSIKEFVPTMISEPEMQNLIKETPSLSLIEHEELKTIRFKSLSRRYQETLPPIMPTRFTTICPEVNQVKKWDKFWKALYKEEWLKGNDFTAIHLFNFGSYVPIFDSKNENDIMKCHLCLQEVNSNAIQNHLYNMCESTKYWWHEIKFTEPMHLKEMLAPSNTSFENLRNLNWFVKTVKKNYSLRRCESPKGDTLLPLRKKEMKKALDETNPMGR